MANSEPLISELRSDFMPDSSADRYLLSVLVLSFVRVQPRENYTASYASRGLRPHHSCPGKLCRNVKYSIVPDGVRDMSWGTRRFAMRIDPSVVLCMLSRTLRDRPLVSERSLSLVPT